MAEGPSPGGSLRQVAHLRPPIQLARASYPLLGV